MSNEKDTFEVLIDVNSKTLEEKAKKCLAVSDYSVIIKSELENFKSTEVILCDEITILNYFKDIQNPANIRQVILLKSETNEIPKLSPNVSPNDFWIVNNPFEVDDFLNTVAKACIMLELERENLLLKSPHRINLSDNFLNSKSKAMKDVLKQVERFAGLEGTVLITGESGTGKTMLAQHIHNLSDHRNGSFINLSCANLPRDLVESELFGHEKGAFTGATFPRAGAAELADKGTLFLDEIGELPIELQPKLLTFLQDKIVHRVGGSGGKKVHARIIAATNSSLDEMIKSKLFREDLYYRLNVFHIKMPALRERIEDLPTLTQNILGRIAKERGVKEISIDKKTLDRLKEYSWPGNIRELENRLERATAYSDRNVVDSKALFESISSSNNKEVENLNDHIQDQEKTLEELEKSIILRRLNTYKGDKQLAAKSLGISLKTLYNKLNKY